MMVPVGSKEGYAGNPCTECPVNCDHTGCNDDFHCQTKHMTLASLVIAATKPACTVRITNVTRKMEHVHVTLDMQLILECPNNCDINSF